MLRFLAPLGAVFLSACGLTLPPLSGPVVWGIPYIAQTVPAGHFDPLDGLAVGYRVQLEEDRVSTFTVAHELAHVWQWEQRSVPLAWLGAPCAVQAEHRCNALEAHADAVGLAAVEAGCLPGDFGWPGEPRSGCVLPHPWAVRP